MQLRMRHRQHPVFLRSHLLLLLRSSSSPFSWLFLMLLQLSSQLSPRYVFIDGEGDWGGEIEGWEGVGVVPLHPTGQPSKRLPHDDQVLAQRCWRLVQDVRNRTVRFVSEEKSKFPSRHLSVSPPDWPPDWLTDRLDKHSPLDAATLQLLDVDTRS